MTDNIVTDSVLSNVCVELLIMLHDGSVETAAEFRRRSNRTYAHVSKTTRWLEDAGYVRREQSGREKLLSLTESGEEIAESLAAIRDATDYDL